jgi:hypothetical protein
MVNRSEDGAFKRGVAEVGAFHKAILTGGEDHLGCVRKHGHLVCTAGVGAKMGDVRGRAVSKVGHTERAVSSTGGNDGAAEIGKSPSLENVASVSRVKASEERL